MVLPITVVPIMVLATIPRAIIGAPMDTPIIGVRIGAIGIGDTITGITIELLAAKMNC